MSLVGIQGHIEIEIVFFYIILHRRGFAAVFGAVGESLCSFDDTLSFHGIGSCLDRARLRAGEAEGRGRPGLAGIFRLAGTDWANL